MSSLQPTLTNERIGVLDVLRGMAIFGILFVNLAHFSFRICICLCLEKRIFSWISGLKLILPPQTY